MTGAVFCKNYASPDFDRREILRYASCRTADAAVLSLMEECIAECAPALSYRVCFSYFPVRNGSVDMGFAKLESAALAKNLIGCGTACVFAATVGMNADRLISRYSRLSPAKALMFDAIGTERIESLCDAFCEDVRGEYGRIRPRFSPGYGDLPIDAQRDIFAALTPEKRIGLTLNGSLLMSPSKSVTAVVGIYKT